MFKKGLFFFPILLFIGCSTKKVANYENLTALSWHQKIYKDIKNSNLEQADENFISLQAEHPKSIYIKNNLLSLFLAHKKDEEFELAKFYLNEYKKRYASLNEIPWIEYQKIKLDFLAYQNAYTNQKHLLDLIESCKNYLSTYPNSNYIYEVNTILAKANLTKKYLDDRISKLYEKLDKPKAANLYKTTIPKNSKEPYIPSYKKLFYW